jgi:hypothetical protein
MFEGRNTLWVFCFISHFLFILFSFRLAYRGGVTRAITAPQSEGFMAGLGVMLDTGASNVVERGAIVQPETALHVRVSLELDVSVSTQVAALRRLLYESSEGAWKRVREVCLRCFIIFGFVLMGVVGCRAGFLWL